MYKELAINKKWHLTAQIGNVLDKITTFIGVGVLGVPEANPLIRIAMEYYGITLGLIISLLITILSLYVSRKRKKYLIGYTIIVSVVVSSNMWLIIMAVK